MAHCWFGMNLSWLVEIIPHDSGLESDFTDNSAKKSVTVVFEKDDEDINIDVNESEDKGDGDKNKDNDKDENKEINGEEDEDGKLKVFKE